MYCFAHDPANAERRSRAASRAARSKPSREIKAIKDQVGTLIKNVISGEVTQGRAAVALQGYNCLLRAADLERRIKETEELEARIAALEERRGVAS